MPQKRRGRVQKGTRAGNKGGAAKIGNTVQPPLKVFIKLSWLDPKSTKDAPKKRPFPKDIEVIVDYSFGVEERVKLAEGGILKLEMGSANARARKSFTIKFVFKGKKHFILCEEEGKDESTTFGELPEAGENGVVAGRAFALPMRFTMVATTWKVDDAHPDKGRFNVDKGVFSLTPSGAAKALATEEKPLEVTLDPHWQYLRVEFFDRFYGHTDHSHKPVTAPALMFEGHRFARLRPRDEIKPETQSNWTLKKGDHEALVQCLPWILQKRIDIGHEDKEDKKPDLASLVLFRTKEKTFVKSKSATEREISIESKELKLNADRLKLYDLPKLWMSRNQWSWPLDKPDEGGWFQDLIAKETTLEKPLCVSLDDIVLTVIKNGKQIPADVKATELPLLFYHTFKEATGGAGGRDNGTYSKEGIYNPGRTLNAAKALVKTLAKNAKLGELRLEKRKVAEDGKRTAARAKPVTEESKNTAEHDRRREIYEEGNKKEEEFLKGDKSEADTAGTTAESAFEAKAVYPFSNIKRPDNLQLWHLVDYPHWTRLVVCQGDLFDVFDQRTHQDTTVADDGKYVVGARAAVRWYDQTNWVEPNNQVAAQPALVRQPSGASSPEFALQVFYRQEYLDRFNVFGGAPGKIGRCDIALLRACDFDGAEEIAVNFQYVKLNFTPPNDGSVDAEPYSNKLVQNVIERYHGDDGLGFSVRPEFRSRDNSVKFKALFTLFLQAIEKPRAHYAVSIQAVNRAWANGHVGTAALGPAYFEVNGAEGRFSSAHETGHFMSLPDDYGESSNYASYGQLDFSENTAGLPFDLDERAMMRSNKEPRARNFWFASEWVRELLKTPNHMKGLPLKVWHGGTYDNFVLPRHSGAPARGYANWPIKKAQIASGKAAATAYLYRLGKDKTSASVLPAYFGGDELDGIVVLPMRIFVIFKKWSAPNHVVLTDQARVQAFVGFFLPNFKASVEAALNKKWIVTGKIDTDEGDSLTYKRAMLHFQPRFLVKNYGDTAKVKAQTGKENLGDFNSLVNSVKNSIPEHHILNVSDRNPAGVSEWADDKEYKLLFDFPTDAAKVKDDFAKFFTEGLGFSNVDPPLDELKTLVANVFPNGTVAAK